MSTPSPESPRYNDLQAASDPDWIDNLPDSPLHPRPSNPEPIKNDTICARSLGQLPNAPTTLNESHAERPLFPQPSNPEQPLTKQELSSEIESFIAYIKTLPPDRIDHFNVAVTETVLKGFAAWLTR